MGHTNLSRSLQMSGFNSHLHVHAQSFFCRSNYFLLFFFFFSLSFLLLSFYSSSEEDFGPNYDNKSLHYLTTTTTASRWPSGEVRRSQVRTALTQNVQDQPGELHFTRLKCTRLKHRTCKTSRGYFASLVVGEARRNQVHTDLTQNVQDQPGALRFARGFKKSACYMVGF